MLLPMGGMDLPYTNTAIIFSRREATFDLGMTTKSETNRSPDILLPDPSYCMGKVAGITVWF